MKIAKKAEASTPVSAGAATTVDEVYEVPEATEVCTAIDEALHKLVLNRHDSDLSSDTCPRPSFSEVQYEGDSSSCSSDSDFVGLGWSVDEGLTETDNSEGEGDELKTKRTNNKINSVVTELRSEKREKLMVAKQNDGKMKKRRNIAERVVNALFLLPFDPEDVKSKIPYIVREDILGLLGSLTAIHLEDIIALGLPEHIYSDSSQSHYKQSLLDYNAKYSSWGTKFIKTLASVLGIEGCMLAWDLVRITEFYRNGKVLGDLPLDMLNLVNPQPRKVSILTYCSTALQSKIESVFVEHLKSATFNSTVSVSSAPPMSPPMTPSSESSPVASAPQPECTGDTSDYVPIYNSLDSHSGPSVEVLEGSTLSIGAVTINGPPQLEVEGGVSSDNSNSEEHCNLLGPKCTDRSGDADRDTPPQTGTDINSSSVTTITGAACESGIQKGHCTISITESTVTSDSLVRPDDSCAQHASVRQRRNTKFEDCIDDDTPTSNNSHIMSQNLEHSSGSQRCSYDEVYEDTGSTRAAEALARKYRQALTLKLDFLSDSEEENLLVEQRIKDVLTKHVVTNDESDAETESQEYEARQKESTKQKNASALSTGDNLLNVPKTSTGDDDNAGWLIPFGRRSVTAATTATTHLTVPNSISDLPSTSPSGTNSSIAGASSCTPSLVDIKLPSKPPNAAALLLRNLVMAYVLTTGNFDARVQRVFLELALALDLTPYVYKCILCQIATHISVYCMYANTKESSKQKQYRRLKIAGVAVGVGVLTALTAGLAAPAVGAGIAAMGIAGTTGMTTFLTTAGGAAVFASLFGAGSMSLAGWKYSKRIAKLQRFEFVMLAKKPEAELQPPSMDTMHPRKSKNRRSSFAVGFGLGGGSSFSEQKKKPSKSSRGRKHKQLVKRSLGLNVCVSGLITQGYRDFITQWDSLADIGEDVYSLLWEPSDLQRLGNILETMISEAFALSATKLWLHYTVAGALSAALMWPVVLIQYSVGLDNAWTVCRIKAEKAGKVLADAITDKQAVGQRPVTLIGYSMGARVVFECLQELHKRREYFCVFDAVMMGLPASTCASKWARARTVVTNRLVNVYCRSDWVLGFLYRYMEWGTTVAGLKPVKCVGAVENYDVTGLVKSHNGYASKIREILAYINFHAPFTRISQEEVLLQMDVKAAARQPRVDKVDDHGDDEGEVTPQRDLEEEHQQLQSRDLSAAVRSSRSCATPPPTRQNRPSVKFQETSSSESPPCVTNHNAVSSPSSGSTPERGRKLGLQRKVASSTDSAVELAPDVPPLTTNTVPVKVRKQVRMSEHAETTEHIRHEEVSPPVKQMTLAENLVEDFTEEVQDGSPASQEESDTPSAVLLARYKTRDYMF